jgi:hypothetical protein
MIVIVGGHSRKNKGPETCALHMGMRLEQTCSSRRRSWTRRQGWVMKYMVTGQKLNLGLKNEIPHFSP